MSKAYISEYAAMPQQQGNLKMITPEPPVASQTVTFTTSTQSAAFNTKTKWARIHVASIASYLVGANPTATTDNARMVAGQTEYIEVNAGDKIAFVDNT